MHTVQFISLGCSRNLVDTEVMMGLVQKAGFSLVAETEKADYIVVNTCGFLEKARQEAIDVIDEIFSLKKTQAKVIVAGCMVRKHESVLKEQFPHVHYYISAGDVEKILEAIRAKDPGSFVGDAKSTIQQGDIPRLSSTPPHYAYIKISEGCKKQCAFCIIPSIKGRLKSRPIEHVVKECEAFVKSGVKELIFIAQDLGDYGKDLKIPNALNQLLKKVVRISGDFWVRLLYLYPDEITDDLIDLIATEKKICPYIDMPIQHINSDILKRMHRKTNREHIVSTLHKLREKLPNIIIRTSLMVGFPGETDEQFAELVDFVKTAQLDNVGIFQYSNEKEAYSARYTEQISESVKERRFQILADAQKAAIEEKNHLWIGRRLKVLVDSYHPESDALLQGHFYGQCPHVDGVVIINDWQKVDHFYDFYEVEITDVSGYDLIGTATRCLSPKKKPLAIVS